MARQNSAYWQKRMEALEDKQYQNGAEYYKDVQKQFREASNNVQVDIERWYQRLADNNNLSYAGAKKLLKKDELDEFHWSVEQYIKAGEENAVDQRWMKELENASARHHISYLEAMKLQTQQHAELLSTEFEGGMTEFLHKSYGDQDYHTAFEIAKGTGLGSNMAQIDSRTIDTLIKKPWAQDGKNFSDRIWTNKDKLVNNLHTELTQSIIRGADPKQAIDNLAKTMEVSKAQAGRLIMTESAAISAAAQKNCFKDLDVERYEILATLDSHTSDICQEMDGKVFDMKDYKVGETAPPFHPHCRSTTIPYFDDEFTKDEERAARDEDTGKTYYVPADMKYEEWGKQFANKKMSLKEEGKWPQKQTKITKEEYRELMQYASDKGIALSGFKQFDGDIGLIKETIDSANEIADRFPEIKTGNKKLTIELSAYMPSDDFATTSGHIIQINADAYRNREVLQREYSQLVDEGWFAKGTDYHSIIRHEMGHVVANLHGINSLEIAKQITGIQSSTELMPFIESNLSQYSVAYADGREIISECFSSVFGSSEPSEFALKFVEECATIKMKGR